MIINHNIAALNTYRQLSSNTTVGQKSLERLSSGLRINRAGDDAAGLAISEKMRAQIRGLDQATRNAQDGISMIQTAEGALNETHSILQRMRELANQSANDTNVDIDRTEIQKEINQLTSEINRIGNTTEFNTQKLLNGGGVDPTTSSSVSGNGLVVPTALTGGEGEGAAVQAKTEIAIANVAADATDDHGKNFKIAIEGTEYTFTFDENASASSVNGTNVTIAISDGLGQDVVGADIANQLNTIISGSDSLKNNYAASYDSGTDTLTVAANAVSINSDGELVGPIDGGSVSAADGTYTGYTPTNTSAKNVHATATIDFTNATIADLKGSEIIINSQRIAFYDSADGAYTGNADLSVDLNGARTPEKIVDAIVAAGHTGTTSNITGVYLTEVDGTKLQITASTAGAAGNDIEMGNNAEVTVTATYGNDRLTNEGVVSANGLADGEHRVTITNVAATITEGTATDGGNGAVGGDTVANVTIAPGSTLSGSIRLVGTGTDNEVKLQELVDGTWTDMTGDYSGNITITDSLEVTKGDITITFAADAATNTDFEGDDGAASHIQFSVVSQHYTATLTESGSDTAGTSVTVNNGQQNVTLNAEDGIGTAVVNIGAWDSDNFDVGDSITWSFETQAAGNESTEVIGGTFKAKFQIGANMGQSFEISVSDMRAQALEVSGASAGATHATVDGAYYTATSNVTNGTDSTNVEYALDVSTHEKATAAVKVINDAIEEVSAQRSELGAYQNRLEHTINNLGTSSENLTAAESRIRDVDMAKEMMEFTKNNILSQAAQAMLAQANQQPQGVLQLLR